MGAATFELIPAKTIVMFQQEESRFFGISKTINSWTE
jgi:hypothetical protein